MSQNTCTSAAETQSNAPYRLSDLEDFKTKHGGEIVQLHRPNTEDPPAWVWVCRDGLQKFIGRQDSVFQEELDGLGLQKFEHTKIDENGHIRKRHNHYSLRVSNDTRTSFDMLPCANALRETLDAHNQWALETTVFCDMTSFLPYRGVEHSAMPLITIHLGEEQRLRFQAFKNYLPESEYVEINMLPGTVCAWSEHALGAGWKCDRAKITFRHTIGCEIQLEKQAIIQSKVYNERRQVHAAEAAAREARMKEVEDRRRKNLAIKAEEAEKKRILKAKQEQEKLERKQARERAAEEKKQAKEAAKAKAKEERELKRKRHIEEKERAKEEAKKERKRLKIEKKKKKKLTDDMFAAQTGVLVRAARLGSDDKSFFDWLKCSPLPQHVALHDAWSSPETIPTDSNHPLGMKTLESTRDLFDRYVDMVRDKRERIDEDLIDAGSTQGISPL